MTMSSHDEGDYGVVSVPQGDVLSVPFVARRTHQVLQNGIKEKQKIF